MAKPSTLRSLLLSMVLLSLASLTSSCRSWQTIMIPRYDSGSGRATNHFGGSIYRLDRQVEGKDHALLAVAVGDTLHLAAQVHADFLGEVVWRVGECQLEFVLEDKPNQSGIPIQVTGDLGTTGALVGHPTTSDDAVTIRMDVPYRALAKGDGTLVLKFVPRDGSDDVVLPASGRLRGVYLMQ